MDSSISTTTPGPSIGSGIAKLKKATTCQQRLNHFPIDAVVMLKWWAVSAMENDSHKKNVTAI